MQRLFTLKFEDRGPHVYVELFVELKNGLPAKAGSLLFRGDEWEAFMTVIRETPQARWETEQL